MDFPRTFDAWEKKLVDFFLVIGPDGDASPIRTFEVTTRVLAQVCGAPHGAESSAEDAFRLMLARDPLLMDSLRLGSQRFEKPDVPNCFSYLVFTLLIDSFLDGNTTQSGEFRQKLVAWLGGSNATVSNLRGVALMWESLAHWLDVRVRSGEPFRRLILPDPGAWSHIGYTRRLSFPSRSDLRLVVKFCQEHPSAHRDPHVAITAFERELIGGRDSWGLRRAFEEFRAAYYRQRRALGDLCFWRLMEQASALTGRPTRSSVTVEMLFDVDQRALFFANPDVDGEAEPFVSLTAALVAADVERSDNLAMAAALGIMFFRLVGTGRWRAEPDAKDSLYGLHVAVAERHLRKIGDRLGALAVSDSWAITTLPLTLESIKAALRIAKLLDTQQERIVRPCLSGGVRSDGIWLGRPRFLPTLESDTSDYVIQNASLGTASEVLGIEHAQLKASEPFDGAFCIHPTLLCGEEQAPWSIRLEFVRNAFVHTTLASARYKLRPLHDWVPNTSVRVATNTHATLVWEPGELACADLLEVVYANGRSGWEEAQIISLLKCADDAVNPWHLLRSLQDAGIVEPRLRAGWKGRVWTLKEPSIIEIHHQGQILAVVEGGLCERLIEDFKLAVEGLGGTPFRRIGVSPWAAPLFGAQGVLASALAERLGWRFVAEPTASTEKPLSFAETRHQALHYVPKDIWSWTAKRFIPGEVANDDVRLLRLTHIGERDHDVYRIVHGNETHHYLSRTAAIVSAHALARAPLFAWCPEDRVITVRGREGGLPDALATETRRRMLCNGGPRGSDYVYPASDEVVHWLAGQLPGCFVGQPPGLQHEVPTMAGLARRSFGRLRLQWRNGSIAL